MLYHLSRADTTHILFNLILYTVCISLYNTIQHSTICTYEEQIRHCPSHKPVGIEHIWVRPHLGVMMNGVNEQENCNTFLEWDTVQYTVLIAQARKAGGQQEIQL